MRADAACSPSESSLLDGTKLAPGKALSASRAALRFVRDVPPTTPVLRGVLPLLVLRGILPSLESQGVLPLLEARGILPSLLVARGVLPSPLVVRGVLPSLLVWGVLPPIPSPVPFILLLCRAIELECELGGVEGVVVGVFVLQGHR